MPGLAICRHCGLPFGGRAVERPDAAFCCFGCAVAHDIITPATDVRTESFSPFHIRIAVAVILSMAVMMFSLISYSGFVGGKADPASDAFGQLFSYLAFLCTVPVLFLLGMPLLRRLRDVHLGHSVWLEVLTLIGVGCAFILSAIHLLRGEGHTYFETVVFTLLFWSIGRYIEASVRTRTMLSLRDAISGLKSRVERIRREESGGGIETADIRGLKLGDRIRLHAGDVVPVDGVIVSGSAYFDESVTSGEYLPRSRAVGENVRAGSAIVDATIEIVLTADPATSTLSRLQEEVSRAVSQRGRLASAADRASRVLVFATILLAIGTFAWWFAAAGAGVGTLNALSVLLVACPCSLGISVPLVVYFALQQARAKGAVFASGEALERAGKIKKLFVDRTGTLTAGLPRFVGACWTGDAEVDRDLVWRTVVSASKRSRHPFSRALSASAGSGGTFPLADCRTMPGAGVMARTQALDEDVWVGSGRMMQTDQSAIPPDLGHHARMIEQRGGHCAYVRLGERVVSVLEFETREHADVPDTLQRLAFLQPEILTGGDSPVHGAGLPVRTGVGPAGKVDAIRAAKEAGRSVAMVGDGLNDAPALAEADFSIAVDNAQDINRAVADARLTAPGIGPLVALFDIARTARRRMWQNIAWSIGYNSIGLGLAITGRLHPLAAAVAMLGSSLFVLWNSRR